MPKAKAMDDKQLKQMAVASRDMLEKAVKIWKIAMKTMQINSYEYSQVCRAGRAAQRLHDSLRITAENRGWSTEELHEIFSYTGHHFS